MDKNCIHFIEHSNIRRDAFHSFYQYIIFPIAAVQHERGPRNSTIRRQMALYIKEAADYSASMGLHHGGSAFPCGAGPLVTPLGVSLSSPFYPGGVPIAAAPLAPPPVTTSPLPGSASPLDQRIPPTHSPVLIHPKPKVRAVFIREKNI